MSTVQEALKAREERKKREQEKAKSNYQASNDRINSALESYKKRKQSNAQSALSDIAKRLNSEIEAAKNVSTPSWGEGSLKTFLESTRESRLNVGKLKREVESYKSYLDEETYNSLFSTVSKLGEGYNSYIRNAEVMEKFDSEDSYNKWYEEYKKQEDEKNAVLSAEDFDEYSNLGANVANPSWEAAHAPLDIGGWKPFGDGETINNMVTFAEAHGKDALRSSNQALADGGTSTYGEIVSLINDHMKDDEKAIYNYYVGKGDTEKANEYLTYITDILRQRQAGKIVEQVDNTALEAVFSLGAGTLGGITGLINVGKLVTGADPIPTSTMQYAHGSMSQNNEGVWKAANDLLYTTGNMTPSILAGTIAGPLAGPMVRKAVGSFVTTLSSAGNSYASMIEEGYGVDEARKYGVMVGITEGALSYAFSGISSIGGRVTGNIVSKVVDGIDNGIARFVADVALNMGSEALEEATQEVLDPVFKMIATGEDFEGIDWSNVAYSALLGGLSAGLLEGVPRGASAIHSNYQTNVQMGGLSNKGAVNAFFKGNENGTKGFKGVAEAYKSGKQTVNEMASTHVNEALEIDPDNKFAQKMQTRLDKGKNASGYQINRLIESNENALVSHDKGKMKSAAEARLTELGESGDVGKLANIIVKSQLGEKLTSSEKKALTESAYGEWVAEELNPDSVNKGFSEDYSNWAESIGTERINAEAYNRAVSTYTGQTDVAEAEGVAESTKANAVTENATSEENAVESEISAPVAGVKSVAKAKMTDAEGNEVEVKPQRFATTDGGEMGVEIEDGKVVAASEVDFGESDLGLVRQAAVDMSSRVGGFSVDTANVFVNGYNEATGQSAGAYIDGWISAYKFGAMKNPPPLSALAANPKTSQLTEEQRKNAYNFGRAFGNEKVVNTVSNNAENISKTDSKKGKGRVIFDGAKYGKNLNERQRASLKALNFIAKALGKDIYVEKLGKGDNGWYNPTDRSIHVDLYAGVEAEALMLFTVSHELNHDIRATLPEKFNTLADAVFEEYTKKFGDHVMEDLIDAKIDFLKEKGDITEDMTEEEAYDLAYEEVICDCLETMLVDSDAMTALSKNIYAKDKTLWEKIKDFFARLVARIRAAYADVVPDTEEGQRFRNLGEGAERIKKLWVEAIVELSEVDKTTGDGKVKHSHTASAKSEFNSKERTPLDKYWEQEYNLYTATDDFYRSVPYGDRHSFARSLANKTSGMTEGEMKIIYVNGYIFEADGYMHGRILAPYNEKTKKLLEVNKNKYDRINENRRLATVWTEAIQDAERGSSGDSDISRRGRSGADDRLLGETSERDSSGDNERVWTNPRTKEDYDEIIKKLREMYDPGAKKFSHKADKKATYADSVYLDAVNRGDMETAQRMVDEAAKKAGYTKTTYHGTTADFTEFKTLYRKEFGFHTGSLTAATDRVQHELNPKILKLYTKLGKTLQSPDVFGWFSGMHDYIFYARGEIEKVDDIELLKSKKKIGKSGALRDVFVENEYLNKMHSALVSYNESGYKKQYADEVLEYTQKYLLSLGYGSLSYKNEYEGAGSTSYLLMKANQVKSADPVTYDDKGNVIPLSERFNPGNSDIRYQHRNTNGMKPRTLLANALETAAQNDIERQKLAQYKEKIDLLNAEEQKLHDLREQIKELSFKKGPRDTEAIKSLQFEANQAANRINTYDRQLFNLESTKALKGVLEREKAQARKRAEEKAEVRRKESVARVKESAAKTQRELMDRYQESRKKATEGRNKTAMRHKIRNVVKDLNKLLNRGTKDRNVKEELKETVASSLALAEVIFSNDITNEDIVRLGVDSVTENESKLLNEYSDLLDTIDALYGKRESFYGTEKVREELLAKVGSVEEQIAKIKNRISTLNSKLSDVFERERARLHRVTIDSIIDDLATKYSRLEKSENDYIKNAYNEFMKTRLEALKESLEGKIARDLDVNQLTELYDTFKAIEHMIRHSNSLFREGRTEDLMTYVSNTQGELYEASTEQKDRGVVIDKLARVFNDFSWNNLRPVDAVERLGSKTFEKLFWDFVHAMGEAARDITEAGEVIASARKKYGYSKWRMDLADTTFTTRDGLKFKPSLADKLSIYAYSQRDQAEDHMVDGGFTYDTGRTYKETEKGKTYVRRKLSNTYRLSKEDIQTIIASLKQEQRDYVDAILPYLTDMGKKGNEVSMTLYGIELFGEKVYFPLQSSKDYLSSTTQTLGATPTMTSLANSGFTKQTKPQANNPIVLRGFDDVVLEHIEKMSNYHALVIPIENLRRVFDNVSRETEGMPISTRALIGSRFGVEAQKYFEQWLTDINGGVMPSGAKSPFFKLFSKAKGVQVSFNSSVVAQQYFSIIRAMEVVNPKYFTPILYGEAKKTDIKQYEELLKYAPIAIVKEMGGFDVGSSGRVKDYIGYEGARKDAKYINKKIDDFTMWGAGQMDKLGWGTIWKAVKAEVASEQKLTPGTEEFYEACRIRFTEVVTKTQVFDSVASRSGYMRSQHDAVKYATSFMGEPTAIVGRYFGAGVELVRSIKSGNKSRIKSASLHFVRTAAVIAVSGVLGNLAKSLIYGGRDDDEDEALLERWARNFAEALKADLNILNSLPFGRDIVSIIEGWDVERPDMTLIADMVTSAKKMVDGDVTFDDSLNLVGSVGNFFGKPLKNVIREIKAVVNVFGDITDDLRPTDIGGAFAEGITGDDRSKTEMLYNSIIRGDTEREENIKATYKNDTAINSAIRKALRENDPRIKMAAECLNAGDLRRRDVILDTIVAEGHFDEKLVGDAIRAEANAIKEESEGDSADSSDDDKDEAYSKYQANDINVAFESGDTALAKEIIQDLIDTKVANGMDEKKAKSSLRSSMTSYWKPIYKTASQAEKSRIRKILYNSGLYGTVNDVVKTAQDWLKD